MNKKIALQHDGMLQDSAKSKHNSKYYFEGRNIRITSTNDSVTGAVTNDKGNQLLLTIPTPLIDFENKIIFYNTETLSYTTNEINELYSDINDFGEQVIVGNGKTKNGFILLTTNNEGFDCVWFLDESTLNLKLLYLRNLDFSTDNPIQILNNYENSKIDKIYWVDGKNQMKFLNIHHSTISGDIENLIDLYSTSLNLTSEVNLSNPIIDDILYGGTHTSGIIQYAYSYYKINGSQSALSPLSELISLGKSNEEGGTVNEIVGSIPKITINNLDSRFTNIRLYSLKYTSYNELPSVNLIADRDVTGLTSFNYYDDGRIIQDITLEEFIFLTGKIIIPKHIESKDNRLFMFNYKDRVYNLTLDKNNIDFRAYSFPINTPQVDVFKNITDYDENTQTPTGDVTSVGINHVTANTFLPENHAAINGYYHNNRYQYNSSIIGGEGPFLKYEIIRTSDNKNNFRDYKFLKEDELYRIGIQLYNKYGIKSLPKWIADFVTSSNSDLISNLNGQYAGIKLTFKPEFYVWLNTSSNFLNEDGQYDDFLKPVGFKLLRADRTVSDRTIISQGLTNGMISQSLKTGYSDDLNTNITRANEGLKIPWLMRRFDDYLFPMRASNSYERIDKRPYSNSLPPTLINPHPQWNGHEADANNEFFTNPGRARNSLYQFNQLMQLYSPEIIFEMVNNIESTKLKVVGTIDNNYNAVKARWEEWEYGNFGSFDVFENALSKFDVKAVGGGGDTSTGAMGLVGPWWTSQDYDHRKRANTVQYFRGYNGTFRKNVNPIIYDIYGKPEISEAGQGSKKYNNDDDLIYINSLTPLITDERTRGGFDVGITTVLANNSRCATFALGEDNTLTKDRPTIESLFQNTSVFGNIPGQIGGIKNNFELSQIVSTESEVSSLSFTNQYIGVLETGNIYYNNNSVDAITVYNFLNVKYIFDNITDYNTFATDPETEDLTSVKIAIVDHVDNNIYEVVDQNTGLAGLVDTTETFDFLEPSSNIIDLYVFNNDELYSLDTSSLNTGYVVGVASTGISYEWTGVEWVENGSFTVDNNYTGGVGLICEFLNSESLKYIGNYYGGNSYEAKTKTVYVEASNYFSFDLLNNLTPTSYIIINPGDTFVQEYKMMKFGKNANNPWNDGLRRTELVTVRLESIINQNKRSDESVKDWMNSFSPSQGDFHSYNRVYSQDSNLIKSQDVSYELKINEDFDTGILSSKIKRPGETIDNWTNISVNDTMYLEGKYGSINGVVKHNDSILAFQDTAIANISINPRVQVQGDDGVGIELGVGNVLHDFKYLTTNSGTLNKWGAISANSGVYYYDTINNSIFNIGSQTNKLTDFKGLHSYFQKNIDSVKIRKDNHILNEGIQIGYDYLNNTIYFTFHQLNDSDTISFNELKNEFISLHDFKPSFYFIKGNTFITSNVNNNKLYEHVEGVYNIYYDVYKPSYIIYNLNPEPYLDCVFDNINFKSEVYYEDQDISNETITDIQAFNDYQDSNLIPLVNNRNGNLRRRFRDWNATIPREGRHRIRGPWIKLKLQFENTNNKKLILHDLIVSYTV